MSNNDHLLRPPSMLAPMSPTANPKIPQKNLQDIRPETSSYAHILTLGRVFKRYGGNSITKAFSGGERYVWVPGSLDAVCWAKNKGDAKFAKMSAKELVYVGPIKRTSSSEELVVAPSPSASSTPSHAATSASHCAFALEFEQGSLELECSSEDERDQWIRMFTWLKENNSTVSRPFNFQHTMSVNSDFTWELSPGQRIDQIFELGPILGQGTFGKVHKAIHKQSGFSLAVKLVNVKSVQDVEDVQREIDVLKQCRFKNIIDYFGCWGPDENNDLWMFMNYCQFGSVIDLLTHANVLLTEMQISYIIGSTLLGLHYLHTVKNIIHRDIKARNVLVSNNGCIKLTDFGISKSLQSSDYNNGMGTIGTGSPHWMAPEVVQDLPATQKSDIWSLGITAIELTTGLPPRATESIYQVMNSTISLPSPSLPVPSPGQAAWSYEFHDFIAQCLRKDPSERPSTAQLLLHPFVKKGLMEIRCLDELLNMLEVPKNPHDDAQLTSSRSPAPSPANNTRTNVPDTRSYSPSSISASTPSNSSFTNEVRTDKDDFDMGESVTTFSSSFTFAIPRSLSHTLPIERLTALQEFALPPYYEVVVGTPHTRNNSLSPYSSYPVRVRKNPTPSSRPCPIIPNTAEPGSQRLSRILASHEPLIVWRRYSDFAWLQTTLRTIYPDTVLPPLPEKTVSSRFDEDVLRERRQGIQWNLEFIARHPVLSRSFVVHQFLVCEEHKVADLKKYVKNRMQEVKKMYKQFHGRMPPGGVLNPDDEPLWRLCAPPPSLPLFSRLKKTCPETEALLCLSDQHHLSVLDAYAKDIVSFVSEIEASLSALHAVYGTTLKILQRVGVLFADVSAASSQGRRMLGVHSRQIMTEKLRAHGYDVSLAKFDLNAYILQKIEVYSEQYQGYYVHALPPLPSVTTITPSPHIPLSAALSSFVDLDTILTPGLTILARDLSRTLSPTISSLTQQVYVSAIYPMVYYGKLYTGLRDLIASRDTHLLHCQIELQKLGVCNGTAIATTGTGAGTNSSHGNSTGNGSSAGSNTSNGTNNVQSTVCYVEVAGYGQEPHDTDAHIDKLLLNADCSLVHEQHKKTQSQAAAVPKRRVSSFSEPEQRPLPSIPQSNPTPSSMPRTASPLLHATASAITLPTLTVVPTPSAAARTASLSLPRTASRDSLDTFTENVLTEFTMIQRQKEAHFAKLARDVCHGMAAAAAKEAIMWNEIIQNLDMLPQEAEFFDLPL